MALRSTSSVHDTSTAAPLQGVPPPTEISAVGSISTDDVELGEIGYAIERREPVAGQDVASLKAMAKGAGAMEPLRLNVNAAAASQAGEVNLQAHMALAGHMGAQHVDDMMTTLNGTLLTVSDAQAFSTYARVPREQVQHTLAAVRSGNAETTVANFAKELPLLTSYVTDSGLPLDVNSLVQWVIREGYLESTKDLYLYAQKVKFFNDVKDKIRQEITAARTAMSSMAGKDEAQRLDKPFVKNPPLKEFTGLTIAQKDPEKDAASKALGSAAAGLNDAQTGSGIVVPRDDEKQKMQPPPSGEMALTKAGFRIDRSGDNITIYGPPKDGKYVLLAEIVVGLGVKEFKPDGSEGTTWAFDGDSTFILPDGTKIAMDTETEVRQVHKRYTGQVSEVSVGATTGAAVGTAIMPGVGTAVGAVAGTVVAAAQHNPDRVAAGAASGALIGTYIFPGVGTAIGAGVGAIAGALSGPKKKRKFFGDVTAVVSIDVLSGAKRVHGGRGDTLGATDDRSKFDAENKDLDTKGALFALQSNGEWAKQENGEFRDIEVAEGADGEKLVLIEKAAIGLTQGQRRAAVDDIGKYQTAFNEALEHAKKLGATVQTKGELEAYISELEEDLNSVGDDAQLANVDLQNMLQRQQQALQMLSNVAKSLHDTAMAVVRNMGG